MYIQREINQLIEEQKTTSITFTNEIENEKYKMCDRWLGGYVGR